ncbi:MAG: Gfo/Idh/MocA family oxidoreductase [Spartobacteria bacterium]|nr:Gfo/Idh/MocA family oxidoreductase [Spartobacteria bacterium]
MGIAIIGCGLIGRKRALALQHASLRVCADTNMAVAKALAKDFGAETASGWRDAISRDDVDAVIVSTSNDSLAKISIEALNRRKHVLLEKPAGRSCTEIEAIIDAAEKANRRVRVGFNHRYHPSFIKAFELLPALGPLMFLRATYGHGGRVGYENEWRMNPDISGGGELIDQGVHLIDLARCFFGEFAHVSGQAQTLYWDAKADDNAFMLLETEKGQTAFMHVSCTEWKNGFSFELYGRDGKLHITGLGGSYGVERLAYYRMTPEMGPPETTIWEYPRGDESWKIEFEEFLTDIQEARDPSAGLPAALAAMRVVEAIYRQTNRKG